jgi:hypothetical protein
MAKLTIALSRQRGPGVQYEVETRIFDSISEAQLLKEKPAVRLSSKPTWLKRCHRLSSSIQLRPDNPLLGVSIHLTCAA